MKRFLKICGVTAYVRYQPGEAPKLTEGQSALPPGVLELPEGKP